MQLQEKKSPNSSVEKKRRDNHVRDNERDQKDVKNEDEGREDDDGGDDDAKDKRLSKKQKSKEKRNEDDDDENEEEKRDDKDDRDGSRPQIKTRDRQTGNQILSEFHDFLETTSTSNPDLEKYDFKRFPSATRNHTLLVKFFSQLNVRDVFGAAMTKQKVRDALIQRLKSVARRMNKDTESIEKEREKSVLVDRRRRHRSRRLKVVADSTFISDMKWTPEQAQKYKKVIFLCLNMLLVQIARAC